jgi:nucleoside-diphosphate-sugar epimerase
MRKNFNEIAWREAVPRIAADLAMVHLSAIVALVAVALWQSLASPAVHSHALIEELYRVYLTTFLPLSPLFPIVFCASGLYTRSRGYAARYKWIVVARGATVATLLFLFVAFVISRAEMLPRSAILVFAVLVNGMTVGARLLKSWIASPADPKDVVIEPTFRSARLRPVLIVGGAGYIGSILCRKLLAQGRKVRLLDSFVYGNSAIRDLLGHPNFELSVGDCRNIQNVVSAMNGVRSVIHLAAIVGDPACEQDKRAALEINYAATRMMTEIAKGYGVQRFLFASSCSVYGETEETVDERSMVKPISLYAQTKVDSELALLRARTDSFHPTILRLATVFGNSSRPRFDLVVNLLTAKALQDGVITIFNGEQWRPFIHVSDVAEGFIRVLDSPIAAVSGEVYNLGDSRMNFTLSGIAEVIKELIPGTRVEHVENPDRRNYRVSFEKIHREIGFECAVSLEHGISDLKTALQGGRIPDYTDPLYHNQRFLMAAGRLVPKEEIDTQVMAAFAVTLENYENGIALAPQT